jgi:hypothetical protein
VLVGLKTRWAAIALGGFCLLTALFFHLGADQTVHFRANIAMAGGFLLLATFGPGAWSLDAWRGRAGARGGTWATIEAIRPEARAPPTVHNVRLEGA